ncbi:MAG: dienelactone hydrolase family protein [Demequina sp.]
MSDAATRDTAHQHRDIAYVHDGTEMLGYLVAPVEGEPRPGILLLHDAFGITDDLKDTARRYAELGYDVFAADIWGERRTPAGGEEIGPMIGSMVGDRARWMGRIGAAHEAFVAQGEVDAAAIVAVGYCFGGSSGLEYLRHGGGLRGVASIHGGLDLLEYDWPEQRPDASVLVCTGAEDPMATAEHRASLTAALSSARVDWEIDLYSGAKHAFTNPKSDLPGMPPGVGYHPRAAARAWETTVRFLAETLTGTPPRPSAPPA